MRTIRHRPAPYKQHFILWQKDRESSNFLPGFLLFLENFFSVYGKKCQKKGKTASAAECQIPTQSFKRGKENGK